MMDRYQRLDNSTLLYFLIGGMGGVRCSIALYRIDKYLDAARRLNTEIAEKLNGLKGPNPDPYAIKSIPDVFVSIHFYFICWNTIGEMLEMLKYSSRLASVNRLCKRCTKTFNHYADGRDALEHFKDRLPKGKRAGTMKVQADLGNIHGSHFTLGGVKWDIGPDSLKELEGIVEALNTDIRAEATPLYDEKTSRRQENGP